jgi:PAS domain S-box-containing protein
MREYLKRRGREAAFRHALMHSLQEGFFLVAEDGVVTEVNEAFGGITGYGPDEAPYPRPYPWVPDADRDRQNWQLHQRIVEQVLREDGGQYTAPLRHRDGRLIWVTATVRAVPAAEADGKMLVGTLRDVTAERETAEREAAVSRLAAELAAATEVAEVLSAALAELRRAFGATRAVAAVWRWHSPVLVAGLPRAGCWLELDDRARNGLEQARKWPVPHDPVEAGDPGQAASVAARLAVGDAEAVVWLDRGASGPLGRRDRALFGLLCTHLEQALARALHFEQARDVALALQHAILGPLVLPAGFAVRYVPAVRPLEVGGDWYDVVALTGGRIGVVVGDCVGRGLEAAAVMGQLRSACRALLLRTEGPAQVLTDLDTFAHRIPGAVCTTVFCAIIDAVSATICYSSAGHPPAILAHAGMDGYALLDQAMSVPLAVLVGEDRPEATARLCQGASLLLYTDGLVERRGARLDDGIDQAGRLLRRYLGCPPDELADRVMAGLAAAGGEDDVAVLIYRVPPPPLSLIVPADPTRLAGMRQSLQQWLDSAGVPPAKAGQVIVSVSEACANAIEHAYASDCAREVEVTARLDDRRVEIVIADTSTWKPSQPGRTDRGRGLTMMRSFMDEVHVDPGPSGSTVRMIKEF